MTLKALSAVDLSIRSVYHVQDNDQGEDYDFIVDYSEKDEAQLMESICKRKALEKAGAIVRFVEPCEIRYDDGCAKAALSVYVVIGG